MFNPKITPGPWVIKENVSPDDHLELIAPNSEPDKYGEKDDSIMGNMSYYPWCPRRFDDWKAIAAVPELLEVYWASKDLLRFIKSYRFETALNVGNHATVMFLEQAIQNIEQRNFKRFVDNDGWIVLDHKSGKYEWPEKSGYYFVTQKSSVKQIWCDPPIEAGQNYVTVKPYIPPKKSWHGTVPKSPWDKTGFGIKLESVIAYKPVKKPNPFVPEVPN